MIYLYIYLIIGYFFFLNQLGDQIKDVKETYPLLKKRYYIVVILITFVIISVLWPIKAYELIKRRLKK